MHETPEDIRALQQLLDRSYEAAGPHLRSITTPERRVSAEDLVELLTGMCLLVVATVTADCQPIAGPLDGIFYRGSFHFGTSPDSVRYRHLLARPQVSATHLPREEFAVNVHGRAIPVAIGDPAHRGLRETLFEVYGPRYGAEEWEQFLEGGDDPAQAPVYMRIEPGRMFTFRMA
ncbi:MAG TPA: pyridoxamine 5'-phosphate oxidase family protein [Solirubrobacteraceae bacterium]|nr:pyridoxamine 5'-phosphate oxidase family protein [Solirubrobacteraceae bacterium]